MSGKKQRCTHFQYHGEPPAINFVNKPHNLVHGDEIERPPQQDQYSAPSGHYRVSSNARPTTTSDPYYKGDPPRGHSGRNDDPPKGYSEWNDDPPKGYSGRNDDPPKGYSGRNDDQQRTNIPNQTKQIVHGNQALVTARASAKVDSTKQLGMTSEYGRYRTNNADDATTDVAGPTMMDVDNDYQTHRKQVPGVCGLVNLGNTCYMNSALQCLSNIPSLRQFFLNPPLTEGELAQSYACLMKDMWSGQHSSIQPSEIKTRISKYSSIFRGYSQADAREFANVLLNSLHDELKDESDNSLVNDLFTINIKYQLTCQNCLHDETGMDQMKFLALRPNVRNGEKTTLDDLLDLYGGKRPLNKNRQCNNCRELFAHFMQNFIYAPLPPVVIVHFTRFNRTRVKDENPVEFPMETQFKHLDSLNKSWYNLIGIVSHIGDIYSGHYTAYAKNTFTQKWYHFNDSSVKLINSPVNEPRISQNAYMLIYAKENKN